LKDFNGKFWAMNLKLLHISHYIHISVDNSTVYTGLEKSLFACILYTVPLLILYYVKFLTGWESLYEL